MIELLQEGNFLFCIVKEIELNIAVDEAAKFDADEADELAAFIDIGEEFKGVCDECAGLCGIGYAALLGKGVEVGVADLDGDATGKSCVLAEVKGEFVHHGAEHAADKFHIQCILAEGALLGHGFLFAVGDDLAAVDGVGAFPEVLAHLPKLTVEERVRNIAEHADRSYAHKAEFLVGLFTDAGDLAGGERG